MLDTSTEAGAKAEKRLRNEPVAWLTTVRSDGTPQPVPVWFLWDGESFLVYSQGSAQKITNIRGNPRVAIHLNSDANGGDVVRAVGTAEVVADAPPLTEIPEYIEKYRPSIPALGMSEDEVAGTFRAAIRVRPESWQVW